MLNQFANFLFRSKKSSTPSTSSRSKPRTRLQLEGLEDRLMPANYLILDFTPDTGGQNFASTFDLRYSNGYAPSFMDMNGDRRITMTDVQLAASYITGRVQTMLRGFNIQVGYGDVTTANGFGTSWLRWGVARPQDQVFVMYFGGWSGQDTTQNFVTGLSPQAPYGYNNETYGRVFSSSLAWALMPGYNSITPSRFINEAAATTVHEFGHLLGLGHVISGDQNPSNNVMNYGMNANVAGVPNRVYLAKLYDARTGRAYSGYQNPAYEMALSLAGQPGYAKFGVNSFREIPVHDDHDDDHGADSPSALGASSTPSSPAPARPVHGLLGSSSLNSPKVGNHALASTGPVLPLAGSSFSLDLGQKHERTSNLPGSANLRAKEGTHQPTSHAHIPSGFFADLDADRDPFEL